MVGAVRTKEKCPRCGGKFEGEPLRCPSCLTVPRRYFVDFFWPVQGRIKLYSDQQGYPLDSWERANRLLTAIRFEIDQGKFDPKEYIKREHKGFVFENYVQEWLKKRERDYQHQLISKKHLRSLNEYAKNYFIPFFGKMSIRDIRDGHIEDFLSWLPTNLSTKTIYNIMGALRKLLRDAYRRRDILVLPQFPKIEIAERPTNWITENEQEKIMAQVQDPVYRAFYLFLMKQGCRPNEARALKWNDVNLKEKIVVIRSAFDMNEYRPFTKEKDVRILPLHPEVKKALLKLPRSLGGFVFVNRQGRPLSACRVYDHWRKAAEAAGIKITCYEGTRHSLASQAVNRGIPMRVIKDFLGHKTEKTTCRYAKIMVSSLTKVWGESNEK